MITRVPGWRSFAAMAAFALSCFLVLLVLWLSFNGPIPLKPRSYTVEVAFPEAVSLVAPVDVRIAGVPVGRVADTRRDARGNRTIAALELDPDHAPIGTDARFVLRQKTLIGETYVEMAPGTAGAPRVADGARLEGRRRVGDVTQLDEILNAFDPRTRERFQTWQQDLGDGIVDLGPELNAALGTLPQTVEEAGDLVSLLNAQSGALRVLVRDGSRTFGALTRESGQLQALARNQSRVLEAIAAERESFAALWRVAPTFFSESRLTLGRLREFGTDNRAAVRAFTPAVRRVGPTVRSLASLAPDLRRLFAVTDPFITASLRSLPASRQVFGALRPALAQLHPVLSELNPMLDWAGLNQHALTDFLSSGLAGTTAPKGYPSNDPGSTGHVTRQFSPTSLEVQALHSRRLDTNRGNAYLPPLWQADPGIGSSGTPVTFDCDNAGGPRERDDEANACREMAPIAFDGKLEKIPAVAARPYLTP